MDLTSQVEGEEAIVAIYADRIEWVGPGVKIGRSLRLDANRVPFRLMHGVDVRPLGFGRSALRIAMLGDVIEFRVPSSQADEARVLLFRLETGLNQSAA